MAITKVFAAPTSTHHKIDQINNFDTVHIKRSMEAPIIKDYYTRLLYKIIIQAIQLLYNFYYTLYKIIIQDSCIRDLAISTFQQCAP